MRMTLRTLQVIAVLMEAPEGELYGFQVIQRTGFAGGLVYPLLAQMETAGWAASRQEDIDPRVEQRPARRYYRLTEAGVAAAEACMAHLPKFPVKEGSGQ